MEIQSLVNFGFLGFWILGFWHDVWSRGDTLKKVKGISHVHVYAYMYI